jgi:hypothetical protein
VPTRYGAVVSDWFVIVPNVLGTALGALELYLIRRDSLAMPKVRRPMLVACCMLYLAC